MVTREAHGAYRAGNMYDIFWGFYIRAQFNSIKITIT